MITIALLRSSSFIEIYLRLRDTNAYSYKNWAGLIAKAHEHVILQGIYIYSRGIDIDSCPCWSSYMYRVLKYTQTRSQQCRGEF